MTFITQVLNGRPGSSSASNDFSHQSDNSWNKSDQDTKNRLSSFADQQSDETGESMISNMDNPIFAIKDDEYPKNRSSFIRFAPQAQADGQPTRFSLRGLWRVSSEDEKRVCSCETHLQREHIFKNFNCPTREWAKWVSESVRGVRGVSGASERT